MCITHVTSECKISLIIFKWQLDPIGVSEYFHSTVLGPFLVNLWIFHADNRYDDFWQLDQPSFQLAAIPYTKYPTHPFFVEFAVLH